MVRRAFIPLIAAAAFLLPVTLLGAFRAGPPLPHDVVSKTNYVARVPADEVLVEWVIRLDDLVACETATPELRRIQHRYRSRVRVVAYAVATDTELVRSFLRRERLPHVQLERITERQFQRDFAQRLGDPARTPTLLVMVNGTNAGAFDAAIRTAAGRRGVSDFAAHVDALLRPASARGE